MTKHRSIIKKQHIKRSISKNIAAIEHITPVKQSKSVSDPADMMNSIQPDTIAILRKHLSRARPNHLTRILEKPSLKAAHAYCVVNSLSAQQYGSLLEQYILDKYNLSKICASEQRGDCTDAERKRNIEIKVSLGGSSHDMFNYVQLRPSHAIDDYLLTAYHLTDENVHEKGELYVFAVPADGMKSLIAAYGGYAHGSVKSLGKISQKSISDSSHEYALRPMFGSECWKAMLPYRIDDIIKFIKE